MGLWQLPPWEGSHRLGGFEAPPSSCGLAAQLPVSMRWGSIFGCLTGKIFFGGIILGPRLENLQPSETGIQHPLANEPHICGHRPYPITMPMANARLMDHKPCSGLFSPSGSHARRRRAPALWLGDRLKL